MSSRKKRAGGNRQLRAQEIDAQDNQSVEAGMFTQAAPDTLKKRRIVKARNRSATKARFAGTKTPTKSNPFSSFNYSGNSVFNAGVVESSVPQPPLGGLAPSTGGAGTDAVEAKFVYQRSRLNKSFHSWVNRQMNKNEYSDWTVGVQDYITHMKKLREKHRNEQKSAPSVIAVGSKVTTPAAKKEASQAEAGKPTEGTEEETRKFESRAKVFEFQKDTKEYKVKGVGDLRVLVHNTTNKSRLVMYDACKRLLLNLNLYKGITFKREGKNNVAFIAKGAGADGTEEVKKRLIRVKNSALADSLKEILSQYC